jgi:ketosteroid isomerase-like protein
MSFAMLRYLGALGCVVASACAGPASTRTETVPFDLAETRRLITQQNAAFTRAHVLGDSATIDAMFTPDARSLPPGADAAVGIAAIHALTVEYLKAGVTEFREETTDLYGNAEYVVDQGTYVMTYGNPAVTERGKYLNVWKQVDGGWKIQTNIWNADAAPVAAAPTPPVMR